MELGDNPPETCKSEVYEPPYDATGDPSAWAYGPRGIDVDTDGLIWTALGGSGHFASFDRSKCAVVNGPTATGQHCTEGWTLYPSPGPRMKGVEGSANADYHYYSWVDQFDERFTRVGPDTLEHAFTVEDPGTYTQSWTAMVLLKRSDEAVYEYACHEGNLAMEGMLAGHRAQESGR